MERALRWSFAYNVFTVFMSLMPLALSVPTAPFFQSFSALALHFTTITIFLNLDVELGGMFRRKRERKLGFYAEWHKPHTAYSIVDTFTGGFEERYAPCVFRGNELVSSLYDETSWKS